MFDRITAGRRRLGRDGTASSRADVILWATGFRAALTHLAPLHLRGPGGGIRMDGTHVAGEPRVHLVGYGPVGQHDRREPGRPVRGASAAPGAAARTGHSPAPPSPAAQGSFRVGSGLPPMAGGPPGRQGRSHDFSPSRGQRGDRMIAARDLTKTYGSKTAVDGITFTVEPGRVTGFLGPNGAGKSTTMRMILGLDRPSAGSVTVNGRRYADSPAPLREVGALLEARALHPGRSARDHLRWLAVSNAHPGGPRRRGARRSSGWRRSPASGSASSPSAWASGSASPSRCSATRRSSSSTSRSTAWTPRASAGCAPSRVSWPPRAARSSSPAT